MLSFSRKLGRAVLVSLSFCVLQAKAAESPRESSAKIFDVRQHGAKGDGKTLDTAAIQKTLDTCGKSGGGVVHFSAGTYLSKPIFLRSKTTLQLDAGAKLMATCEAAGFSGPEQGDLA